MNLNTKPRRPTTVVLCALATALMAQPAAQAAFSKAAVPKAAVPKAVVPKAADTTPNVYPRLKPSRVPQVRVLEGSDDSLRIRFVIELDRAPVAPATLFFSTLPVYRERFASAGIDYGQNTGTLEFAPGQRRAVVYVRIFDDDIPESTERVALKLFDPVGLDLSRAGAEPTLVLYGDIEDDDHDEAFRQGLA